MNNTSPATIPAKMATATTSATSDIDGIISSILESSSRTVQALLFFCAFILIGALCKKYLRFILWGFLVTLILVKWLEYQNALSLNWPVFYQLIGLPASGNINTLFIRIFEWIKNNPINFMAGFIGFLIGYRPMGSHKGVAIKIAK